MNWDQWKKSPEVREVVTGIVALLFGALVTFLSLDVQAICAMLTGG